MIAAAIAAVHVTTPPTKTPIPAIVPLEIDSVICSKNHSSCFEKGENNIIENVEKSKNYNYRCLTTNSNSFDLYEQQWLFHPSQS